jgi:hypothetical protein
MNTAQCPGYQQRLAVPDDQTVNDIVAVATDLQWHLNPAHPHLFCGGCGDEAAQCHPGRCCTDVTDRLNVLDGVCDLCSTRRATGQVA